MVYCFSEQSSTFPAHRSWLLSVRLRSCYPWNSIHSKLWAQLHSLNLRCRPSISKQRRTQHLQLLTDAKNLHLVLQVLHFITCSEKREDQDGGLAVSSGNRDVGLLAPRKTVRMLPRQLICVWCLTAFAICQSSSIPDLFHPFCSAHG